MICPCCSGDMVREDHRGVPLDLCPTCPGVWFDRGEREAYLDGCEPPTLPPVSGLDAVFRPTGESTHVRCPRCERDILRTGTVGRRCVMRCTTCGGLFLPLSDLNSDILRNNRIVRAALQAMDEIVAALGAAASGGGDGETHS